MNMNNVVLEVAKGLVNCFNNNNSIVFPEYHNKGNEKYRISEQESKILFANEFIKNKIRFAVEVPTKSTHQQTGQTERSARFDLVTYKNESYNFDWVVELKSKNPPEYHFQKDFEKMVKSESKCLWFHTLKNADNNTYEVLLKKIKNGINNEIKNFVGKYDWKFVIVVLEKMELYSLDISLDKGKEIETVTIDKFDNISEKLNEILEK